MKNLRNVYFAFVANFCCWTPAIRMDAFQPVGIYNFTN